LWALDLHALPEFPGQALTHFFLLLTAAGTCPITSGQQTIDSLGLDVLTIGQCIGILISYITFFSTLAYIGVRFLKW
jgi:ATP-binding cassette subfamily G (WHITE) protein 2